MEISKGKTLWQKRFTPLNSARPSDQKGLNFAMNVKVNIVLFLPTF